MNFCFTRPVYDITFTVSGLTPGSNDMTTGAYLLLPNLAIPTTTTLLLECLDPPAKHIAKCAGIRDKVLELLVDALARRIVCRVQGARVEVRDAVDVVVEGSNVVLNGGDLHNRPYMSMPTFPRCAEMPMSWKAPCSRATTDAAGQEQRRPDRERTSL